jgi:putative intracellular protease/amidase
MLSSLWLAVTSRVGRYVAAIAAVAAILLAAYRRGGKDAAARATEQRLKSISKAREVEDEVDRLGGDDLDRELNRWMRHD